MHGCDDELGGRSADLISDNGVDYTGHEHSFLAITSIANACEYNCDLL
jgi:hypothetical protein